MAHMPLPNVGGVVARSPQPVPHRGHLIGFQPPHTAISGPFAQPIGLSNAVHIGILTGQQARSTGDTRSRRHIVALKVDTILGEPAAGQEMLVAPGLYLG